MIPESFKQDLLNRVDIVDVVSRYVQLKKGGANYLGLCPFHGEKTPSFTVSPSKQFYHCFGCGAHGNAIGFQMEYGGMGYVDAIKDLAASAGMQVPELRPRTAEEAARQERETDLYDVMEKAMAFYRAQLKGSPRAIEYLKGRGLTGEIAARFRVGYAPDGWQGLKETFPEYEDKALVECGLVIEGDEGKRYDRFRDRVMFPILNARGAVVGFGGRVLGDGEPKYLNSPETSLFQKGQEIYGLVQARDSIRASGRVLVVEGYMDVVALAQFEVGYAVATLGTATTPIHVAKLLRLADEIVFCFDGDTAGRKAARRALEVGLPVAPDNKPIKFLFLPEGEDPDTYIRRHGKEQFESLVHSAETLSQFLLSELRSGSNLETGEGRSRFVSAAQPYIQKITAPILRIQLINAVAEIGKISQDDVRELLKVPEGPRFKRPAPARRSAPVVNRTHEWNLLYSVLVDLPMFVHINPALLGERHPETQALLAIRDVCQSAAEDLSFRALLEGLEGNPSLDLVLNANRFGEELGFNQEEARVEIQWALSRLDVIRREKELESLRVTGLLSRDQRLEYQSKLNEYNLLRGAVRADAPAH
ncbi:MAG TPA: DNA primase [Burkholderiales bacterium]|nr:DNA primase [Burkholderiales bacterium]